MKPFRRTGFNVPLNCPLPKCRARGTWGTLPHACFSCFVLFAPSKENEVAPAIPAAQLASEQFRKISVLRLLFSCLDNGRRNWTALRPRGPFLFRSAGKGSKRGRFARHFGSGGRGGHSPTRVSLASFSLHRAKRMKLRQRNLHHNESNQTDFTL